jgi:glycosyltransferase involved in cell wall biosynthesis
MISIIIPSYNQQEYLSDAIESALTQTTAPLEIIVVDDGSTDSSVAIARSYVDNRTPGQVKVISQVNKGLASARNTGIMNATGEYILPLDADDMLMDNCLERILAMIRETDADIVAPSFKQFGVHNHEVVLGDPTLADFRSANRIGYFSAIRRSKLLEVGGYSPRMIWGYEDYALWFDLLKRGARLVTIKEVLVMYRTKEQSMIHEAQAHHVELMQQIMKDHAECFR